MCNPGDCTNQPSPTATPPPGGGGGGGNPPGGGDQTPDGWHDPPESCNNLVGWACDLDRPSQALWIHFWEGSNYIGAVQANAARESAVGARCGLRKS